MKYLTRQMRAAGRGPAGPSLRSFAAVGVLIAALSAAVFFGTRNSVQAGGGGAGGGPTVRDAALSVRPVVTGLNTPTSLAFLGANDMLVLEKSTGKVMRVVNGAVAGTVLDLAVNNASERGLLGIALDPNFATNHFVYLYWTCRAPPGPDQFTPSVRECPDQPAMGDDTDDILAVPLLGNRLDRFVWNGSTLTFDRNLIKLRSFQNDGQAPIPPGQGNTPQPPRGNHNGGALVFGPDGKLYLFFGDQGRRGQLQNLPSGPTPTGMGAMVADDQFGGPQPDSAHMSGVILRLNPDGTAPSDNPFFAAGTAMGGEVGANIQKIFAYGVRNSFGLAFDPVSGFLWDEQNGDDSFDEINRVEPGMNGGWVQVMGPIARIAEYKRIETTYVTPSRQSTPTPSVPSLQQLRWPPSNIADTPQDAMARLFMLPGAHYKDPEFAWRYAIAPAGIGFVRGQGLGADYVNTLWVGSATPNPMGGYSTASG